jgi:hypothetical protein
VRKRYLEQVPGPRPHITVDRHAPVADFEAIALRYPCSGSLRWPGGAEFLVVLHRACSRDQGPRWW